MKETSERLTALRSLRSGLARESLRISQQPELLWQIIYNRLQWDRGLIHDLLMSQERLSRTADAAPWLRELLPPHETAGLLRAFAPSVELRGGTMWRPKIECTALSSDGSLVAAGGSGALFVWDVNSGRQLAYREATGICHCVFTRNGDTLITAGYRQRKVDGETVFSVEIVTWNTDNWTERGTDQVTTERGFLRASTVSDDSTRLVAAVDQKLLVWDTVEHCHLLTRSTEANIYCCAFSPNGTLFASGDERDTLLIWDTSTWTVCGTFQCGLHGLFSPTVFTCAFSQDQQLVIAGGSGGQVRIWELASGREVGALRRGNGSGADPAMVKACAPSHDGQFLATAGSDHLLWIWDLASGRGLASFAGHTGRVDACAWSLGDSHLVSGGEDGKVMVWNAQLRSASRADVSAHSGDIKSCAISHNGGYFVTTSYDRTAKVWDLASGRTLHTLDGHTAEIRACAIHPDDAIVVTGDDNERIAAWNVRSAKQLAWMSTSSSPGQQIVTDLAFSPDGRWFVAALTNQLQRWNSITWNRERNYEAHTPFDELRFCAISPDTSLVVSGGDDEKLTVWRSSTGELLQVIEHPGKVRRLAFSPDGTFLVTTSSDWHYLSGLIVMPDVPYDRTIVVWDTDTWNQRLSLKWHVTYITGCGVTADGSHIVAASDDGGIRAWDARTGKVRADLTTFHSLFCLAVHPSKPVVVGGGAGGDMLVGELVGIPLGPLVVTAWRASERLELTCPRCQTTQALQEHLLGKQVTCSTAGCEAQLRLNTFTLFTDPDSSIPSSPANAPSSVITADSKRGQRRFWRFWK